MEPILELERVSVSFAGLTAVNDVSFSVGSGQILSIIGPNGAGKTTLFNAITGFVLPTQGCVRFGGRVLSGRRPHDVAAQGVRRTFQNGGVFPQMRVLENVLAGVRRTDDAGPFGVMLGLPRSRSAESAWVASALELLETMGIAGLADRYAGDLSFGQQRLVEITRAIAGEMRLLLLDEPAVGLSQAERAHLMSVMRKLAGRGITVLMVEHVIDLVMEVSDTIVVLNYGQVLAQGTPQEIRANRDVLEAYLGK
jgi:branched-chain amino acid transport system ATP-binding protein